MAMNTVELQQSLSLTQFMAQYGTEAKCRRALFRSHRSTGYRCPKCKGGVSSPCRRSAPFDCRYRARHYETTLLSGTVWEATKPAEKCQFLAFHLLNSIKTDAAALELKQPPGVSYRTAARLKQKLMEAMILREEMRQLNDSVQIDDACLSFERTGGEPARGSENKQGIVVAVQTGANPAHPTFAAIKPVGTFGNDAMTKWATRRQAPQAEVFSDGLGGFRRSETGVRSHTLIESDGARAATGIDRARWSNVLQSNLKRYIRGTHHTFKPYTYARRYRAEAACPFNRLLGLPAFMPRLLHSIVLCKSSPDPLLRQPVNFSNRG